MQALPPATAYCVGYSGGLDSHVLLHALAALRPGLSGPLRAVHVDHGLHPESAGWADHCARVCASLGIPLTVERVEVRPRAGESLEAAARQARYAGYMHVLAAGEALVLGHHRDDQAETVLLRLLRGAGVRGLAAMSPARPFEQGRLLRPLLGVPRRALADYAERHRLRWIEDPSNSDSRFDRNFIRARIAPALEARWPGYAASLARAADNAREGAALLDELAGQDLASVGSQAGLYVERLARLSEARQRNLLRYWIRLHGAEAPSRERLSVALRGLLSAAGDRRPELRWPGGLIRRYQGRLVFDAGAVMPIPPAPLAWDLRRPVALPQGQLHARAGEGVGVRAALAGRADLSLRFRQGGEHCRPAGRAHGSSLKKLLQEAGVPPWERQYLPLLFVGEALAAVADLWVCEGFQSRLGEAGIELVWTRE